MLAGGKVAERIGTGAEMIVRIGQIGLGADHADLELAGAPALADARVEDSGFLARVRTHDQKYVRLLDPGDRWIEDPGRPPRIGVEGIAALHRQVGGAAFGQQLLQRKHLFDRGDVARYRADPLAVDAAGFRCDRGKRLSPRRGAELAVFSNIGPVEPLGAQAIDDVTGLVGNPFLVDRLVDARQHPHHLAPAGVDADRRTNAVHHVYRLRLAELPWTRGERIRF